jgi:hypothetical protein
MRSPIVEVGDTGVDDGRVYEPRLKHLLQRLFARARKPDGADSDAALRRCGDPAAMKSGMRIRARKEEPEGDITDIVCFEPEAA